MTLLATVWAWIKKIGIVWDWIKAAWSCLKGQRRLRRDVDALMVKQEQGAEPVRAPNGWRLRKGIYWGRQADDETVNAFCGECLSPLIKQDRFTNGNLHPVWVLFICRKCKADVSLTHSDVDEAIRSVDA